MPPRAPPRHGPVLRKMGGPVGSGRQHGRVPPTPETFPRLSQHSPDVIDQQHRAIRHDRQVTGIEVGQDLHIPERDLLLGPAVEHWGTGTSVDSAGDTIVAPTNPCHILPCPAPSAPSQPPHRHHPCPCATVLSRSPLSTERYFPDTVSWRHRTTGGGSTVSRVLTAGTRLVREHGMWGHREGEGTQGCSYPAP